MFGSRYNLHVALAWSHRENNPELVQDEHEPQARLFYEREREEMLLRQLEAPGASLTSSRSKPLGRIVSTSAVLGPAGWLRRSKRDKASRSLARNGQPGDKGDMDRDGSLTTSTGGPGRTRPHRLAPIHSVKSVDGSGRKDVPGFQGRLGGLILPEHMEFLAQYQAYTTTRKLLEDEGFFDTEWDRKKLAGEQFGFNQQEQLLNPPETKVKEGNEGEADFSNEAAEAGRKERQKAARRVVISAKPASTLVLSDSPGEESDAKDGGGTSVSEGTASGQKDGNSTGTGGSRSSLANDRESSAATATSDLMSRFYARLQELTETKDEDERAASNVDVATRNKIRMRIKTALRRLLNSRLFPDKNKGQIEVQDSRGHPSQPGEGSSIVFTPGTATPLTVASRSNIASRQSRFNAEDVSVRQGTRGKVVFVGESSHLTASSTDPAAGEINGDMQAQQSEEQTERVAYYRRHPLAPLKSGGISRLYQPVRPPSRSRTSLSQASLQRDGLKGDKAFLQRLHNTQGIRRENTCWSLPGEKGQDNNSSNPISGWRRERNTTSAWSYNMGKLPGAADARQKSPSDHFITNHDWLKDVDDLELRKLLEELYRDKKYMDRIIDTKEADDQTELEVCHRLEDGRDYLLSRAMFWKEKGPLPPRPPTTDLGLRLQRERTMQSRMTNERPRESRIEGALSRQETKTSLAKQQNPGSTSNQVSSAPMMGLSSAKERENLQRKEASDTDTTTEYQQEIQRNRQEQKISNSPNQNSEQDSQLSRKEGNKGNQKVSDQSDITNKSELSPNAASRDTEHVEHHSRPPSSNVSEVEFLEQEQQHQQQHKESSHTEKRHQNHSL